MEKGTLRKQRYFIEKDLFFQTLTLLLTVLLGGFLLLLLSKTISGYVDSSVLFLLLFVGYFLLIIFFAWSLSRKFIGPFSRLKECMKDIAKGDLTLRLRVRQGDDVRIKSFVEDANRVVSTVNSCLERIKQPSCEIQRLTEAVLQKFETDGGGARPEILNDLRDIQAQTRMVCDCLQQFRTKNRSALEA